MEMISGGVWFLILVSTLSGVCAGFLVEIPLVAGFLLVLFTGCQGIGFGVFIQLSGMNFAMSVIFAGMCAHAHIWPRVFDFRSNRAMMRHLGPPLALLIVLNLGFLYG